MDIIMHFFSLPCKLCKEGFLLEVMLLFFMNALYYIVISVFGPQLFRKPQRSVTPNSDPQRQRYFKNCCNVQGCFSKIEPYS